MLCMCIIKSINFEFLENPIKKVIVIIFKLILPNICDMNDVFTLRYSMATFIIYHTDTRVIGLRTSPSTIFV